MLDREKSLSSFSASSIIPVGSMITPDTIVLLSSDNRNTRAPSLRSATSIIREGFEEQIDGTADGIADVIAADGIADGLPRGKIVMVLPIVKP